MAKPRRKSKPVNTPEPVVPVTPKPPTPPEPRVYSDENAERNFTELPSRLDETLLVVRYTGRKRAYIHYGRAGNGCAFWYLNRSDGPRLLKIYPPERARDCFSELLAPIENWRASVNPDPMSESYFDICPDEGIVEQNIRTRYLDDG